MTRAPRCRIESRPPSWSRHANGSCIRSEATRRVPATVSSVGRELSGSASVTTIGCETSTISAAPSSTSRGILWSRDSAGGRRSGDSPRERRRDGTIDDASITPGVISCLASGDVNAAGAHQHDVGCIRIEGDRCRLGSSTLVRTPGGVRHRKTGRQPATPPAPCGARLRSSDSPCPLPSALCGARLQACECGLHPTRPNPAHWHSPVSAR